MKYLSTLLLALLISACGVQTDLRQQSANQIARPAFMTERFISADDFQLKAWERMHQNGGVATIYIEGDSKTLGASTPHTPVALMLAAQDPSKNLGYLGRPCQFIKFPEEKSCDDNYWKEKIYTPEVIAAYETALNDIVDQYDINGIHIVGYDGGANIAAILAARNKNVLSLRTVAGNLNPSLTYSNHGGTALNSNSLYATDYGIALSDVPQMHFIGTKDTYITPDIYHSYRQTVGLSDCINFELVQGASHIKGWENKWPKLLTLRPYCDESYKVLPRPTPTPTDAEIPKTLYKELIK